MSGLLLNGLAGLWHTAGQRRAITAVGLRTNVKALAPKVR
jgi:hypothetical protein